MVAYICYIFLFLVVAGCTNVILKRKLQYWLFQETIRSIKMKAVKKPSQDIHIMFCFVDHFEPGNRGAEPDKQRERINAWVMRYPELADKHKDSDGICPQHTFFYPPHYDIDNHLERITGLCARGYGEVEMHLHHDRQKPWPDTSDTLRKKIQDCVKDFSRYGIFCLPGGIKKYGFIHGDWALANSLKNGEHCGVNDELSILKETGCYADFTFPVCLESQPKLTNSFFYAHSSPDYPAGYNKNMVLSTSHSVIDRSGLLLIQGIIGLRWKSRTHKYIPSIEQSNISLSDLPSRARIDYWINKWVHVDGKPNWIFIKIHTHGAREEDREVLLGKYSDDMYSYLETRYNDKQNYYLHYVSAREMYNIIRAAETGKTGNPHDFRDFEVPRYTYLPDR